MAVRAQDIPAVGGPKRVRPGAGRAPAKPQGAGALFFPPIEGIDFGSDAGFHDRFLFRYDNDDVDKRAKALQDALEWGTPFIHHMRQGFAASAEQEREQGSFARALLTDFLHAIGIYEHNGRLISAQAVLPGNVLNFVY